MSQLSAIKDAGAKVANARRVNDEALAQSMEQWAFKAIRLEDDKVAGRKAFEEGFRGDK